MAEDFIEYAMVQALDVQDVVDLYQAGGWWRESAQARQRIPAMIKGSYCFLIATDQGKPVGMGRVISDGVSDAYIQDVVVKKEYRGRHIGKEIVRRLTERCVADGLAWIGLVAEPHTSEFYQDLGFHPLQDYRPMLYRRIPESG